MLIPARRINTRPERGRKAVGSMRIRIANALRQAGEAFGFECAETPEPFSYGERTIRFAAPVKVEGSYVYDGKAFSVSADVQAVLDAVCARCTKPFEEQISFSFTERFVRDAEETDDESYAYAGDELELGKAVMDNLLLELPIASVCRADCKGLCPVCGADRNVTVCHCKETGAAEKGALYRALSDEE